MSRLRAVLAGLLFSATAIAAEPAASEPLRIASPDGRITIEFSLPDGAPTYRVTFAGREVIRPSSLGFVLRVPGAERASVEELVDGFALVESKTREIDESWKTVWGTAAVVRNHCNELVVRLRQDAPLKRKMNVIFRAFDDGIGFRCEIPAQPGLADFEIGAEKTYFRFAGNNTAWWFPADYDGDEHVYSRTPLSRLTSANTPLTMKTAEGVYLSVHEADLTDYASMTLAAVADDEGSLRSELVPWPDGVKVKTRTPMVTPWRTVLIADRAGGLMESQLILNLNDPCAIADTSWIEPMVYMGIWWSLHVGKEEWKAGPNHGATTENAKKHIDFAAAHGIRGLLIEGWNLGWETWFRGDTFSFTKPYPDFDLEGVAAYAKEKGVALIGHHETGGKIASYEEQMEDAFALYERLGVRAVKTGYAGEILPKGQHHHGQWMVNHYQKVVERAAAHRISIDVHECIKPTGLCRTWPNLMSGEGVRGGEYEAWSEGNPPEHTTILPFTRCLAGPVDYTPGILNPILKPYRQDKQVHTTAAKQLALMVVLYSPVQMAADLIENYENNPAFAFTRGLPATWDETRVISAEIGDFVLVVRRKGPDWYVGAITDEEPRELDLPLAFLDAGREYEATIYADGKDAHWQTNPTPVEISTNKVGAADVLKLRLAASGGAAIRIAPRPTTP